ncbi:hypothetical protein K501DRAFT_286476 [Backusella circina FSU 941]|nr:hypothetical protein K501DRAFT_286476 [Backusella circina FSU 941]
MVNLPRDHCIAIIIADYNGKSLMKTRHCLEWNGIKAKRNTVMFLDVQNEKEYNIHAIRKFYR